MSDEKDPVVHSSLSKPLSISSTILVLVTGWALYDEVYGIRPWKTYQAKFVKAYSKYLKGAEGGETALEQQIKNSPEYKKLTVQMEAAAKSVSSQVAKIDERVNQELVPRTLALNEPFQEVRSHIGALTYEIETTHSESGKEKLRREIEEIKKEVKTVKLPLPNGDIEKKDMTFDQMSAELASMKDEKAKLLQQR